MGALGCRDSRIAYLLPRSLLLPFAARHPELALGAGLDTRHLRAADLGNRGHALPAGAIDLRDGTACAGGYRSGLWCPEAQVVAAVLRGRPAAVAGLLPPVRGP